MCVEEGEKGRFRSGWWESRVQQQQHSVGWVALFFFFFLSFFLSLLVKSTVSVVAETEKGRWSKILPSSFPSIRSSPSPPSLPFNSYSVLLSVCVCVFYFPFYKYIFSLSLFSFFFMYIFFFDYYCCLLLSKWSTSSSSFSLPFSFLFFSVPFCVPSWSNRPIQQGGLSSWFV